MYRENFPPFQHHHFTPPSFTNSMKHVGDILGAFGDFPGYKIFDIKRGGFGIVYLTYELRRYALDEKQFYERRERLGWGADREWQPKPWCVSVHKTFREDLLTESLAEEFIKEGSIWLRLPQIPNVVELEFVQRFDGTPYLTCEYVPPSGPGNSLRDWIRRGKTEARPDLAYQIAVGMADISAAMNTKYGLEFVHCDLKPDNVLIKRSSERIGPKVLALINDFGLSRLAYTHFVKGKPLDFPLGNQVVGTPHYMSPEQWLGRPLSSRSDIYSYGCMLFEMFTGGPPFEGRNMEELSRKHLLKNFALPSELNPSVPRYLENIIVRCLSKEPSERFSAFEEIARELETGACGALENTRNGLAALSKLYSERRHYTTPNGESTLGFEKLISQACGFINLRLFSEALTFAQDALNEYPKIWLRGEGYVLSAIAYRQLNQPEEELGALVAGSAWLDSKIPIVIRWARRRRKSTEPWEDMQFWCYKTIRLIESMFDIYLRILRCCEQRKDRDACLEYFSDLCARHKNISEAMLILAECHTTQLAQRIKLVDHVSESMKTAREIVGKVSL